MAISNATNRPQTQRPSAISRSQELAAKGQPTEQKLEAQRTEQLEQATKVPVEAAVVHGAREAAQARDLTAKARLDGAQTQDGRRVGEDAGGPVETAAKRNPSVGRGYGWRGGGWKASAASNDRPSSPTATEASSQGASAADRPELHVKRGLTADQDGNVQIARHYGWAGGGWQTDRGGNTNT